ncbi:MAG: hypothetical protein H6907_09755 [Hyphomicrobiales bacterium]|nr:hypothetical protein [Hyphomicrobiales bacterium]MCP5372003.1 hypothetical protein [Hyphomicrobiales bacterium]
MTTATLNNILVFRRLGFLAVHGGFPGRLRAFLASALARLAPRPDALSRDRRPDPLVPGPTVAPLQDVNGALILMDAARRRAATDATARRRHP